METRNMNRRMDWETPVVKTDLLRENIREQVLEHAKDFKTSWVSLGRALYMIWQDKLFHGWGFEKFEHYTERELGLKKEVSLKLLKTYIFLEQDEPDYLKEDYTEDRDALKVPGYEAINVLRMAKGKKEILKDDYSKLKKDVFEKGRDVGLVRKDLTSIIKERKQVDPDEERERRHQQSLLRVVNSLRTFQKDMEVLKLVPEDVVDEAKKLVDKLQVLITRQMDS